MNILSEEKVLLNAKPSNKEEAIELAGKLLVQAGHVTEDYIQKMIEREEQITTFMGNGVAIPHGTNESKSFIKSTGLSIVQIPEGVDFGNGNTAYIVIGIAALGDEHLNILSNIALFIAEESNVQKLIQAKSTNELVSLLEGGF
jgi:mannitol PTS system EIIA component